MASYFSFTHTLTHAHTCSSSLSHSLSSDSQTHTHTHTHTLLALSFTNSRSHMLFLSLSCHRFETLLWWWSFAKATRRHLVNERDVINDIFVARLEETITSGDHPFWGGFGKENLGKIYCKLVYMFVILCNNLCLFSLKRWCQLGLASFTQKPILLTRSLTN